jgi:hypothetical protein
MNEIMGNTLASLYTCPRGLLRRRRWKLGVRVINYFIVKFPKVLGSTTYVDCHSKPLSFCMITPGPNAKQTCLTGYSTIDGRLWITPSLTVLCPMDPLSSNWLASDLQKKLTWNNTVISWLWHLTQMSSTMQCEPCCHGGTMSVLMVLKWKSDVYHLLPGAMYTLKSEQQQRASYFVFMARYYLHGHIQEDKMGRACCINERMQKCIVRCWNLKERHHLKT